MDLGSDDLPGVDAQLFLAPGIADFLLWRGLRIKRGQLACVYGLEAAVRRLHRINEFGIWPVRHIDKTNVVVLAVHASR